MTERKTQKDPEDQKLDTMLVLQGGGSLGAYECGVFKALHRRGIKFDVLAGSSIGAVNASIIWGAEIAGKDPAVTLEDFWLELAEYNVRLPSRLFPAPTYLPESTIPDDKTMAILSSLYTIFYGNPKAFLPRWFMPNFLGNFSSYGWNYLYDTTPLKDTLRRYLDSSGLKKFKGTSSSSESHAASKVDKNNDHPRLIITCTDIQKGEPVIFDNHNTDIDVDKVVACTSYPFYGIRSSEINGKFLWDGSLLTNTPMAEAIRACPHADKILYIVDVFPRHQNEIPGNLSEVWHRARDIMSMDKTDKNIEKLKIIEKHEVLLSKIFGVINSNDSQMAQSAKAKLKELEQEYRELSEQNGSKIKKVIRIGRTEKMHYLFEDADFSFYRINKLIKEGEEDADRTLDSDNA